MNYHLGVSPEEDGLDRTRWPVDEWRLVETAPDPCDLGVTETLFAVANGYLGMRGNVEEGRDSHTHGTFVNGFHETWPIRHAEEAYGYARTGQTLVNAPDGKVIRLYVDDEPLLVPTADLTEYERALDFRDGILRRSMIWRTPSGKQVQIDSTRMVSFVERHLAVMTYEVTLLDDDAPVAISSYVLNRQDGEDEYHVPEMAMGEGRDPRQVDQIDRRVLEPIHNGHDAGTNRVELGHRCFESQMTLAVVADHQIDTTNEVDIDYELGEDVAKVTHRIRARKGVPIRLVKFVSYHSSRGVPVPELLVRCHRTLDRAVEEGASALQEEQHEWLNGFWERSDVRIAERPEFQQALRWNLFQLLQASARADGLGIPAKGVSGSGYSGHYFWDTETYMLPFLTWTNPTMARNALGFRFSMLDAARERARELSVGGALFPWRTINGKEASAHYAAGTAQYHINADVAYALNQYIRSTGDLEFLDHEGVDILVETARMWVDLGFWRAGTEGSFHIHGVTGPDEYTTVVNDNLFTNVMARDNLRRAAEAVADLAERNPEAYERMVVRLALEDDETESWLRAADDMSIPFDEHMNLHPQDVHFLEREVWDLENTPPERRPLLLHHHPLVIYRFQVIKQPDVILAMYLQGDQFTLEQKRANFEYYDPITTGDSSLAEAIQAIIAAEVGYQDLALRYLCGALFFDLLDRHQNTVDGVHVASAGGTWSALVAGFGGFRCYDGRISFDPRLPADWTELEFRLTIRGTRLAVTLRPESICFSIEADEPSPGIDPWDRIVNVRGTEYRVEPGEATEVALTDQGPVIEGSPPPVPGRQRADGTVISAVVPGAWTPGNGEPRP